LNPTGNVRTLARRFRRLQQRFPDIPIVLGWNSFSATGIDAALRQSAREYAARLPQPKPRRPKTEALSQESRERVGEALAEIAANGGRR
jgi:hypothetical protein